MPEYRIAHWWIQPDQLLISRGKKQHHVPAKKMQVLNCLLENAGATVSREYLTEHIWQGNRYIAPKGINNAIWNLRQIFDDDILTIETVPKKGYRIHSRTPIEQIDNSPPPSIAQRLRRYHLVSIITAIGIAFLGGALLLTMKEGAPRLITRSQALPLAREFVFNPALSPDGSALLYTGRTSDQQPDIYLHHLVDQNQSRQLTATPYAERSPQWSPDGDQVAFLRIVDPENCELIVKHRQDGNESRIGRCHPHAINALAWSQASGKLAFIHFADDGSKLMILDKVFKTERVIPLNDEPDIGNALSWSPDGSKLAISSQPLNTGSRIDVFDIGSGRIIPALADENTAIFGHTWYNQRQLILSSNRDGGHWLWTYQLDKHQFTPLLTTTGAALQPSYVQGHRRILFQQQGLYSIIGNIRLSNPVDVITVDTAMPSFQPAPCGDSSIVFTSNHTGSSQIWLHDKYTTEQRPLTPPEWRAHSPVCSPTGDRIAFIGHCAQAKETALCTMSRDEFQATPLWPGEYISGFISWHNGSWLFPRKSEQGAEILRIHQDGRLIARYAIPFPAGIVRAHPYHPALLFSSPQQSGLWQLNTTSGKSTRLDIQLLDTQWAMWDVSASGLIYIHTDVHQSSIVQRPWEDPTASHSYPIQDFHLADNGRLMWEENENRAWLIHIKHAYTQIRLADLAP